MPVDDLLEASELIAAALLSYTANGHSYDPDLLKELEELMTRTADLSEKIKNSLPYVQTMERPPIPIRLTHPSKSFKTVGELFEQIDMGEFISPGGSLSNNIAYDQLKHLFKRDITIEEASRLLNSGEHNANKKGGEGGSDSSSLTVDEDGNLKE